MPHLVRAVVGVERRGDAVDLHLAGVAFVALDPLPGIITGESPGEQGLEQRLPNSPDLGPANPVALRPAVLTVAAATPEVLSLTFRGAGDDAGTDWPEVPDAAAFGMLVDEPPGGSPLELVEAGDGTLELRTAALTLRVRRRPFGFELAERSGAVLARSGGDRRQVAGFPLTAAMAWEAGEWCSVSVELAPGELVAGLGEQFGSLVHNGRRLELVASDAFGTGTGEVYKAVPLLHSSADWSAFVHTPGPLVADVGSRHPGILELVAEEERLDLWLIGGTDLLGRLEAYTSLTGRMPLVPRWALGLWMSRCRYRTRAELEAAAAGMRAHRVPCDLVHVDPDWLERDRLNCDFVWSDEKYPDPEAMVAGLRRDGFRVSVWELPYLDPESPLHDEAEAAGYLVRRADGSLAAASRAFARDGRPRALVDFSNPAARAWWQELNRSLVRLGFSVLQCDFGEGLPDDAVMTDGRSGRSWHNLYPLWYNRTVAEVLEAAADGAVEAGSMILGRSGWAGSQRYPAQWGGDPEASVAGLASTLRAGLGWSLSAPGLWGHDIGGFYGDGPSPGLYIRWAQAGCLSPLARFHGLTPREPWEMGEAALRIVRDFAELRYRLLPYLESAVHESARTGCPVMRPLALEAPEVTALWRVEHEWLLGADLLVVAVLDDRLDPKPVEVQLPPGRWVDLWTGEARDGPASFVETVPIERIPLYVRAGAVIPMGPVGACCDQIPAGTWELHAFGGADRTTEVHGPHGTARYRLVTSNAETVTAVGADEPVPLATGAVLHEPGGQRALPLVGWS